MGGPEKPRAPRPAPGVQFEFPIRLTQDEVDGFIELSGDHNRIHTDPLAAGRSPIGKIAVPGLLSALVFSRVLGTIFPGHGTVYKSQTLHWLKPMHINRDYIARFTVLTQVPSRRPNHASAHIKTEIRDTVSGEVTLRGEAAVLYPSP
jgi:acyl dehydratase